MSDNHIDILEAILPYEPTDEQPYIEYKQYAQIKLITTNYILFLTPGKSYIIKNRSGNPVYIAQGTSPNILENAHEQMIGGLSYEVAVDPTKYTWVRASVVDTIISVRPIDAIDPTEDIFTLGTAINNVSAKHNEHIERTDNPHKVTKEQVGLGNLPNELSDKIDSNKSDVLATSNAVKQVHDKLKNHLSDTNNPHKVTKTQIGLGLVENYSVADPDNIDDLLSTVNNKYITPAAAHRIARLATATGTRAKPQMIIESMMGVRELGWLSSECDAPTNHTIKYGKIRITLQPGLVVSFAADNKTLISEKLSTELTSVVPTSDGTYFEYVDIDANNVIYNVGVTNIEPMYGPSRNDAPGDWFNTAKCVMYNANNEPIRRVYIGIVYMLDGEITKIVNAPLGDRYVFPIVDKLVLSNRYVFDNPFGTEHVKVTAEVNYRDAFYKTEWNDQIGVIGNSHPGYGSTMLVVQCGQMGFLSCGRESGSAFGSVYSTINLPMRARVVVERTGF